MLQIVLILLPVSSNGQGNAIAHVVLVQSFIYSKPGLFLWSQMVSRPDSIPARDSMRVQVQSQRADAVTYKTENARKRKKKTWQRIGQIGLIVLFIAVFLIGIAAIYLVLSLLAIFK